MMKANIIDIEELDDYFYLIKIESELKLALLQYERYKALLKSSRANLRVLQKEFDTIREKCPAYKSDAELLENLVKVRQWDKKKTSILKPSS